MCTAWEPGRQSDPGSSGQHGTTGSQVLAGWEGNTVEEGSSVQWISKEGEGLGETLSPRPPVSQTCWSRHFLGGRPIQS